ncbi:probable terpene synthase 6 [Tripterygium wilfordii]|uniref:probable terpene synthase 6 n=1 Tax=Tripterygium wilfordii TaxID=458696 RepID=UPI0018F7E5B9|nr:probable terpene synthase 6 [Tripterygium wilfordii]
MPRFEEYMDNAGLSTCYHVMANVAFTGMGEIAGVKEFEWLKSFPKIDEATMIICRLMDDLVTTEREKQWKHIPTGIECYMKTYGVSEEEAVEEFQRNISNAWKDINEELIKPTRPLLMIFLNLARVMDVLYKYKDAYTYSASLKDIIKSLFIDAIPIHACMLVFLLVLPIVGAHDEAFNRIRQMHYVTSHHDLNFIITSHHDFYAFMIVCNINYCMPQSFKKSSIHEF